MMKSEIIFSIFVINFRTIFADFYSGTISWETVALPPSTQVRIHGRYGFKYNSGPGCGSVPPGSFASSLANSNELACTHGCSPVQNITGGDLNYYCASYTSEWEQGDEFLTHSFPSTNSFTVSYTGPPWLPHDHGAPGNVHFRTTINLRTRSDTGRPNSSPVSSSFPIYTIPMDCITSIQLPVYDPDDDTVACRWAAGTECGGVCNGLPASKIDTQRCILTVQPKLVTGFKANGVYVITLTVEDFPKKTITVGPNRVGPSNPLSQVPLQFLIKTVQKTTGTCSDVPTISNPTPQNGQVYIVPKTDTFTQRVYATFHSPATGIQDFVVSVPYGTRKSVLRSEGGTTFSIELTWQPTQDQYSTNTLCFQAKDNRGVFSEQHCFTILAGVEDPCNANPCLNGGSCRVELDSYVCTCAAGYNGKNCSIDINDCLSTPCKNGGTCMDQVNDYLCFCPIGFMGKDCTAIDHCASSPCDNFGTCTTTNTGYTCTCSTGYIGPRCQTELDECASSPCENGATCVDMVGDFFCQCPIEFKGKNCSTPNDFCNPNPCLHGGVCTNYDNSYKCSCPRGYIGLDCEIYQPESCSADDENHCMCLLNGRRVKLPFPQEKQDGFTTDDLVAGIVGLPIGIAVGVLACVIWHKLIRPRCCNGSNGNRRPRERPGSSSSDKSLISRDSTASPSDIRASVKSPVSMISPAFTNPYRHNRSTDWSS